MQAVADWISDAFYPDMSDVVAQKRQLCDKAIIVPESGFTIRKQEKQIIGSFLPEQRKNHEPGTLSRATKLRWRRRALSQASPYGAPLEALHRMRPFILIDHWIFVETGPLQVTRVTLLQGYS
jgi:hypothetical protein